MFDLKILEVTKDNKKEYLNQIAELEIKVLNDMEKKGREGQLFITGKEDIEAYVDSKDNTVEIAVDEDNKVVAAIYITQNQIPFTYNDITKYFKFGPQYKEYVKSLYDNQNDYKNDMLEAYKMKLEAYEYAQKKVLDEFPQYETIQNFLKHELEEKNNKYHEKSELRERINVNMSQYINSKGSCYKDLYEKFYWITAKDIEEEFSKKIDTNNNLNIKEYEEFLQSEISKEYSEILKKGNLKVYDTYKDNSKYYTANTENSIEIDTYITDPEYRQSGLAKIIVFQGIKKHIQKYFANKDNKEIFLCSTLHKYNLPSKYVSEFFGLKDNLFVNRRNGRDREVHICKITRDKHQKYLESMEKKLAVLYNYNIGKNISIDDKLQVLNEQLEYEKNELARLKRAKKSKGKKFKGTSLRTLESKVSKIDLLKNKIKETKVEKRGEEENER